MTRSNRQSGQTLIIAVIILGVLLILGLAFTSIVSRNIFTEGRSRSLGVASDLADAGARYAHDQLLNSELGADWRPEPNDPATFIDSRGFTRDPDALYIRPGTGLPLRRPGDSRLDEGGPDGLGPFTRVEFQNGRALVRVRYAPSDLAADGTGALRNPARARNYLMIEAVGRPGVVRSNDPTLLLAEAVQVANFGTNEELFRSELGRLRRVDARNVNSRRLMAFASIGIIETGRFITNRHRVNRPAEIGCLTPPAPNDEGPSRETLGVRYELQQVSAPTVWGGEFNPGDGRRATGSLFSNADLIVHGRHDVYLDPALGDGWLIAGRIRGANDNAVLYLQRPGDAEPFEVRNNAPNSLDSRRDGFYTIFGMLRDGAQKVDLQGYPRSVGRKEPPSILRADPATNVTRYLQMTRNSGVQLGRFNTGRFGWGRGVYVDSNERANQPGEQERSTSEVGRALVNDWLNPGNPRSLGWRGAFYVPIGAYLRLTPDGFVITRDSRSRQPFWRYVDARNPANPSLVNTRDSRARFRVRRLADGRVFILNNFVARDGTQLPRQLLERPVVTDQDFVTYGQEFNGVLYFEGDVRVRGVIPTNIQLSVVSMGTIYVEGSITKGVVTERGALLSSPSTSMLMLMARDYVAINTTQFFAPAPGDDIAPKFAYADEDRANPLEIGFDQSRVSRAVANLQAQFLLNPIDATGRPNRDPQSWQPYALQYVSAGNGLPMDSLLLLSHAADAGGPSVIQMDVSANVFADSNPPSRFFNAYFFPREFDFGAGGRVQFNGVSEFFGGAPGSRVPALGVGATAASRFPSIETIATPIARRTGLSYANRRMQTTAGNPEGQYQLALQDETNLQIRIGSAGLGASKNYLLERVAITPFDVRIEAAIFAEEGSFFVIPGKPFNLNAADTRLRFDENVAELVRRGTPQRQAIEIAQARRYLEVGSTPEVPFYGEPLNVRVTILGAISENMPPPIDQQAAWQRQWGWMPRFIGASGVMIPRQHVPPGYDLSQNRYVPNLILNYDPALATGAVEGRPIRTDARDRALPPMPRLPVSPTLSYFGEVNP